MTPSTTSICRGDLVLVQFQFEPAPGALPPEIKRRPCLVVSSDWYHSGRQEAILVAVTSNQSRVALPGEVRLTHWSEVGLRKPSVVTMILRTVKQSAVSVKLGRLPNEELERVTASLRRSVGL